MSKRSDDINLENKDDMNDDELVAANDPDDEDYSDESPENNASNAMDVDGSEGFELAATTKKTNKSKKTRKKKQSASGSSKRIGKTELFKKFTSLKLAIENKREAEIEALLDKKLASANFDRVYPNNTPIAFAIANENLALVKKMLALGAVINFKTFSGFLEAYTKKIIKKSGGLNEEALKQINTPNDFYNLIFENIDSKKLSEVHMGQLMARNAPLTCVEFFFKKDVEITEMALQYCLHKEFYYKFFEVFLKKFLEINHYNQATQTENEKKNISFGLSRILGICTSNILPTVNDRINKIKEIITNLLKIGQLDLNKIYIHEMLFPNKNYKTAYRKTRTSKHPCNPLKVEAPLVLLAAYHKNIELIKFLTSLNADINLCCQLTGTSPLIMSIMQSDFESAEYLLKCGANVSLETLKSSKPKFNNSNKYSSELNQSETISALKCAVGLWNTKIISLILQAGIDPNTIIFEDHTILFFALKNKDTTVVDLLLKSSKINLYHTVTTVSPTIGYPSSLQAGLWSTPLNEAIEIQNFNYVKAFYHNNLHDNAKQKALKSAINNYFSIHPVNTNLSMVDIKRRKSEALNILKFLISNNMPKNWSIQENHPYTVIDCIHYQHDKEQIDFLKQLINLEYYLDTIGLIQLLVASIDSRNEELFQYILNKTCTFLVDKEHKEKLITILSMALLRVCSEHSGCNSIQSQGKKSTKAEISNEITDDNFLIQCTNRLLEKGANVNFIANVRGGGNIFRYELIDYPKLRFINESRIIIPIPKHDYNSGNIKAPLLYYAICNKRKDIIEILIKNNADVSLNVDIFILFLSDPNNKNNTFSLNEVAKYLNEKSILQIFNKFNTTDKEVLESFNNKNLNEYRYRLKNYVAMNQTPQLKNKLLTFLSIQMVKICNSKEVDANKKEKIYNEFFAEATKLLLSYGLSPNFKVQTALAAQQEGQYYSEPVLMSAVRNGRREIVEILLKNGTNVNARNARLQSCLMSAAFENDYYTFKLLLSFNADINLLDDKQIHVIIYAINPWKREIVKLLIEKNYSINMTLEGNETLIFHAIRANDEEIINLLLDKDANINVRSTENNKSPFDLIILQHVNPIHARIAKKIMDSKKLSEETKLLAMEAAITQKADTILDFLIQNTDPNIQWPYPYRTPLGCAIVLKNENAATKIIEAGRYLHNIPPNGLHPLFLAIANSLVPIVKLLLEKGGIDLEMTDSEGLTPLHYASKQTEIEILKMVTHLKVNLEAVDKQGRGALFHSIMASYLGNALYLITLGVNVNKLTKSGLSPLDQLLTSKMNEMHSLMTKPSNNPELRTQAEGCTRRGEIVYFSLIKSGVLFDLKKITEFNQYISNFTEYMAIPNKNYFSLGAQKIIFLFSDTLYNSPSSSNFYRNIETLKERLFLEYKFSVSVNAKRISDHKTALHLAIEKNNTLLIFLLLFDGVNIDIADNKSKTARELLSAEFRYLAVVCQEYITIKNEFDRLSKSVTSTSSPSLSTNIINSELKTNKEQTSADIVKLKDKAYKWINTIENVNCGDPDLLIQIKDYLYNALNFFYDFNMMDKNPCLDRKIAYTAVSKISPTYYNYQQICALKTTLILHKDLRGNATASLEDTNDLDNDCEPWIDNYLNAFKYTSIFHTKEEQEIADMMFSKYAAEFVSKENSVLGIKGINGFNPTAMKSLLVAYKDLNQKYKTLLANSPANQSSGSSSGNSKEDKVLEKSGKKPTTTPLFDQAKVIQKNEHKRKVEDSNAAAVDDPSNPAKRPKTEVSKKDTADKPDNDRDKNTSAGK